MNKLIELKVKASECTACPLDCWRKNVVFGRGPIDAKLMLIGDFPNDVDDETGQPFTGKAGALMLKMLSLAGIVRDDIYVTNVIKCRVPQGTKPKDLILDACKGWVVEEIELIKPKIIVICGEIAFRSLIHKKDAGFEFSIDSICRWNHIKCPTLTIRHPRTMLNKPQAEMNLIYHATINALKKAKNYI